MMKKDLEANTNVSHYRIVSKIGAGGMGEVYLAEDTKLDRKVAIKFLNEEFSRDTDKLNRFIQEAKAASALNHPNILTVYEIGEVDGKNYIATEFIAGRTLREHLSLKESISLNAILKIGRTATPKSWISVWRS
ncbi:MAG: protein kinase [Acidobacteria bacterium]|nr:protein kinase [Acidobacteriota bacterium]